MANLNSSFLEFDKKLNINESKNTKLEQARTALMEKIKKGFEEKEGYSVPKFWTQGSFQMDTMIKTESNKCDLDLGVYFKEIPDVTGETVQKNIFDIVDDQTKTPSNHKQRCVRVNYKSEFHIDLPVYHFTDEMAHPMLAVKGEEFQESDPKEFYEWFNEKCKGASQKRRLIKYLKSWGDKHNKKMPSGLAMTVLTLDHFVEDGRDDIALLKTLKEIKISVKANWSCILPTCPNDDVLARLTETQKTNFLEAIDKLIEALNLSTSESTNEEEAKDICTKLFGIHFPPSKKQIRLREKAVLMSSNKHFTDSDGQITEDGDVKNKSHKFYGQE
jgi:hypothetical protein